MSQAEMQYAENDNLSFIFLKAMKILSNSLYRFV